jgi:hypothetical protein
MPDFSVGTQTIELKLTMECKINVLTSKKKVMKYNNLSIFKLKIGEFVNQIVEE